MTAPLSNLTSTIQFTVTWNAQLNLVGTAYNPITNAGRITKQQSNGTATANTTLGGSDSFISSITSIPPSSSATIDLTNITDILSRTGVSLARIKAFLIQLLSVADDSVNGSDCLGISVGGTTTSPNNLLMFSGTITGSNTTGTAVLTFSPAAPPAGTLITIAGATGNTNINTTGIVYNISGSNASIATVNASTGATTPVTSNAALTNTPTWMEAGAIMVKNGGITGYTDTQFTGTNTSAVPGILVASTSKNLFITNLDGGTSGTGSGKHTAAVQITIIGGST